MSGLELLPLAAMFGGNGRNSMDQYRLTRGRFREEFDTGDDGHTTLQALRARMRAARLSELRDMGFDTAPRQGRSMQRSQDTRRRAREQIEESRRLLASDRAAAAPPPPPPPPEQEPVQAAAPEQERGWWPAATAAVVGGGGGGGGGGGKGGDGEGEGGVSGFAYSRNDSNSSSSSNSNSPSSWYDPMSAAKALLVDALMSVFDENERTNPALLIFVDTALQVAGAGNYMTLPAIIAGVYALRQLPTVTTDDLWSILGYSSAYDGKRVKRSKKTRRFNTPRRRRRRHVI
jgi:hypothetical protein